MQTRLPLALCKINFNTSNFGLVAALLAQKRTFYAIDQPRCYANLTVLYCGL